MEECFPMGRYERRVPVREKIKKYRRGILLTAFVLLIGLGICLFLFRDKTVMDVGSPAESTAPVAKDPDSIAIPGYEGITLTADKKKQTIAFSNPARNTCLFVISLRLEDGTLLWESDEIRPGEKSDPVVLKQALPAGTYPNATLEYACFTDDENRTALNGATTKLTLRVG